MADKEKNETEKLIKKIKRMSGRATGSFAVGKWDKSLRIIKQGEDLIKSFHGYLPKELEDPHCKLLTQKWSINYNRGYLTRAFEIAKEYLTIAEKYGNKIHVAIAIGDIGSCYYRIGDLDKALLYSGRAIKIWEESSSNEDFFSLFNRINEFSAAMRIALEKNDLDAAKNFFNDLEGLYEKGLKDEVLTTQYKYNKALLLQSNVRARDRVKAEQLFKEVIESENSAGFHKIRALVGLCQLLLVELRMTGEMDVINEINPLLKSLIDLAQQWNSDTYLMEAYIIQGKVALLTFDIKTARRFLMQAQRIAERRGYNGVAEEIASLHDDLKGKLDAWERLEKNNAPLSERIKLARLDDHIDGQFRTKIIKMERVEQKEVTVYKDSKTCLVCKGNVEGFNVFICPQCNAIYCRKCAEAVVEIENACWTCESPIDASRPSKPFEQEKEIFKKGKSDKKAPKGEPK